MTNTVSAKERELLCSFCRTELDVGYRSTSCADRERTTQDSKPLGAILYRHFVLECNMDEFPVRLEVQSWVIVGVAEEPNESEEHDEPEMQTCHSNAKSTCGIAR